jgi:hypothetical protein
LESALRCSADRLTISCSHSCEGSPSFRSCQSIRTSSGWSDRQFISHYGMGTREGMGEWARHDRRELGVFKQRR